MSSPQHLMTLAEVAAALPGSRLAGDPATPLLRVATDTRSLQRGDLFVALRGERFDANELLPQAAAAGASAALAERDPAAAGLAGVQVADSRLALGQLSAAWRQRFTGPLIAVTGSNGKTTCTQMLASVLRAHWGDAGLATEGNFNNDIGVPLTLLRLRPAHQAAVVELGMNHPGEIDYLRRLAQPTVALVNNAQREHQEFMGTVDAVAQENGQVLVGLGAQGVAVFPADEPYAELWTGLAGPARCLRFSSTPAVAAEVSLVSASWAGAAWSVQAQSPQGLLNYRLQVAGLHNVRNSLAVLACALAAGVPVAAIEQGLADFSPVKGRSRAWVANWSSAGATRPITVVDDTYNANPDSVRAAIDVLAALPAPRLLVLGDMGEVGNQGPAFHAEAGAYARERGIDQLFALGEQSVEAVQAFGAAGRHFADYPALQDAVLQSLSHAASVLVKGSRFMKMERVTGAIDAAAQASVQEEVAHAPRA
ncbi:UDP-N-acetylmuramoyl-tripeptide--D-alanyl-D-alanine ligase [Curvibacter sp. HBC61]|uniref:UDP-N-acetylmuramoyl-tripeptide--D-alanyl-D-alanine ligase n=1 Tax=Curvibacter cyanobacteriorum TaxID=3026422 RepID=A0ABT5N2X1_9BURK|nr:UDP-N-acetylmuramoyl-tripeptide--D-alanyl-D-alanine ligase [Curvibacter sp. HBC61]MDD0840011.1 UDP-N-acetylmuramoyl-tripeptide--D-alanyl-D-alanine ligase [Curvibacter sp. HBC61]